jgi:short-subunit dehydrogenase involved in D-alanine esterification of teichoic acids
MRLTGRTILIAGGSAGTGVAFALKFAQSGFNLF